MNDQAVVEHTRRWIAAFVIELGLCPFARQVFDAGRIRYAVSAARDEAALLDDLTRELQWLRAVPCTELETTLLIHPHVLGSFLDFNDFLGDADRLLGQLRLVGVIQIASFHPQYQFADAEADAADNYTNRSPYPMLHLLREASVTEAIGDADPSEEITRRNLETMRHLGRASILEKLQELDG